MKEQIYIFLTFTVKVWCLFPVFMIDCSWIHRVCTPGRSPRWEQPAAPAPSPRRLLSLSLTHFHKVDTLTPSAGAPLFTPHPGCIYLPVPRSPGPLHGPLRAPRAAPPTLPSHEVINACLLQKSQSISLPGRWGVKQGRGKTAERRKWRRPGPTRRIDAEDCGSLQRWAADDQRWLKATEDLLVAACHGESSKHSSSSFAVCY